MKKLEEKNKKRKLKRGESLITDKSAINESHSLKGLIQALFRVRSNKSGPIFHSAEFLRLEKLLNRKRGELTSIFKAIDKKRKNTGLGDSFRGSFGYNELINFYIDH
jgi:predicted RNA-binding protein